MSNKPHSISYIKTGFLIVLILISIFFITSSIQNYFADITGNTEISLTEKEKFVTAIKENNFEYLNSITTTPNILLIDEYKKFKNKIDIQTEIKSEYLFFSFLGLKPNSSILHNVYGSYSKKTKDIKIFPSLTFSVLHFNKNLSTLTLKNTSNTIIPADKTLILLPNNIKIQSDDLDILLPNESKKYFITKEIEDIKNLTFIESVNYGYKAKISTVK